jgi:hypothetical protein
MKFKSDIEVQAGLKDSSGSNGTSGQVLSTTGSTVSWINQTTIANDVQNLVKAGVAINKGQAVYVTGADGTNIIVGLASNTSEATSSKTLGLLNATVAINGMADVVQIGRLAGLNTIGAIVGDPVWLGTNGNLIYGLANKPYAPAHLVFIGIVTRVNTNNGEIFINVQNGFELNEIHDVDLKTTVPINGDILGYNGTLWVNKTIAGWLGYTPANASGTTNYVSKFTGTTTLGNSQIFDNGTNVGIGTTAPSEKLDVYGVIRGIFAGDPGTGGITGKLLAYAPSAYGVVFRGYSSGAHSIQVQRESNAAQVYPLGLQPLGGNVGIGTITPLKLLDVNGDALINTLTVGKGAGNQIYNTVLGYQALGGNTTGNENVAIGYQALLVNSTGGTNVGIGVAALKLNETGGDNTAVGTVALFNNTTGSGNTAIGYSTLNASVDGYANTNIGYSCGALASSPIGTTLIGYNLKYRPSTSSDPLSDSDFAISQYWNEYPGKPHFYAPNKIAIGASTNTEILSVSWDAYNAFFVDYSFDDSGGNLRAGTIKCIFASVSGTFYYELTDDVTPDIGTTTNLSFDVIDDGSHNAVLRVINSDAATYIRFTSRLLFKTI